MAVTIYHNPSCGISRNALAMIRQSGEEPEVIEHLKTPPTRERVIELLRAMNMRPRELLRRKGTPVAELISMPIIPLDTGLAARQARQQTNNRLSVGRARSSQMFYR
jgi:arsenate reductase-like glutaredoxin family protein